MFVFLIGVQNLDHPHPSLNVEVEIIVLRPSILNIGVLTWCQEAPMLLGKGNYYDTTVGETSQGRSSDLSEKRL